MNKRIIRDIIGIFLSAFCEDKFRTRIKVWHFANLSLFCQTKSFCFDQQIYDEQRSGQNI